MSPTRAFRLSAFLPLGIASAALGYAEASLLPEVGAFAILVLIALVVIYRMESRMRHLTVGEFNRLGVCIGVATVLWAGFRILREFKTGEFATLGWTVFLVALIAPVLLALVCALLLRTDKNPYDYWFVQGAGLAAIVLAGAMAEQTLLVVFTALYALSAVWFLVQFFPARSGASGDLARSRIAWAGVWLTVAAILALPLYLLTPKSPFEKLEFGSSRIEIGYAADQMIDLTQTGELQENLETAFEVHATESGGRPKEDLSPDQRWRGAVLVTYTSGSWRRDAQTSFPTAPDVRTSGAWSPPSLGSQAFKLTFTVPAKLRSRFLLDPVEWEKDQTVPVAELNEEGAAGPAWLRMGNGMMFGRTGGIRGNERDFHYVQYSRPPAEPDLSPPYVISPNANLNRVLLANPVPSLKDYTDKVLNELVAAGRLPAGVRTRDEVRLESPERFHEAIARALRDHLSERSDLSYTTSLKRVNRSVDPVEDFLYHSKAGHCERYATALVLMLRSQGIPAVLVLGFKGSEHVGNGKYLVRQEFAHAWAEALISRPDAEKKRVNHHWLSLDPSPAQERSTSSADANTGLSWAAIERLIFHNSPEDRDRAMRAISDLFTSPGFLAAIAGLVAAFVLWRIVRRRSKVDTADAGTAWFKQLVAALAPHGLVPEPGETAREFATRASLRLPAALADVPEEWVNLHYRERFGGASIDPAERTGSERRLHELGRPPEARV